MSLPKYPDVKVPLLGEDGNAFAIIGRTTKELKRAKVGSDEVESYMKEAMSGDYDNVLRVTQRWVDTGQDD